MIRKGEKGYYANGTSGQYWVDFSPKPKYIHRREYEKMSELQQKYFYKTHDLWNREHYVLNFPNYYFVLKIKPNILTHYIEKGSELEKEFQYWKDILDNPNNPLWTNLLLTLKRITNEQFRTTSTILPNRCYGQCF